MSGLVSEGVRELVREGGREGGKQTDRQTRHLTPPPIQHGHHKPPMHRSWRRG